MTPCPACVLGVPEDKHADFWEFLHRHAARSATPSSEEDGCVVCFEPSHDIDYHDHHYHPQDKTTYIGEAHATPDNAGRSSIRRQDIEWLVDDSIRAGRISVSRGAEILGIGIREMRAIGTRFSESTGSEGGAS